DRFRRRAAARSAPSSEFPLVRGDRVFLPEQITELVDALEQAAARERVDGEGDAGVAERESARFEVDADPRSWRGQQDLVRRPIDDHRQEPVLQCIATEDV